MSKDVDEIERRLASAREQVRIDPTDRNKARFQGLARDLRARRETERGNAAEVAATERDATVSPEAVTGTAGVN